MQFQSQESTLAFPYLGHKMLLKIIFHLSQDSCITSSQENIVHIDNEKRNPRSHAPNENE